MFDRMIKVIYFAFLLVFLSSLSYILILKHQGKEVHVFFMVLAYGTSFPIVVSLLALFVDWLNRHK